MVGVIIVTLLAEMVYIFTKGDATIKKCTFGAHPWVPSF